MYAYGNALQSFEINLSYIQHSFHCAINKTVHHIKQVPWITCSANNILRTALLMRNISLEIKKVGYSGEFYFKATLDMVIYKEIGQLLLQYQFR